MFILQNVEVANIDSSKFFKLLERRLKLFEKTLQVKKERFNNISENDTYEDIFADISQLGISCLNGISRDYQQLKYARKDDVEVNSNRKDKFNT